MQKSKFDPQKHHRKSIRLKEYDYSQVGAYYVTIVTYQRDCLFGEVVNGEMILNEYGKVADECWRAIPEHFPNVELGLHVIMPNHVHGIIVIADDRRGAAMLRPYDNNSTHKINVKPGSLGATVRSYKSAVSYRIHKELNATGIWQRNYYDHIIRDEKDLKNKTDYIEANPMLWDEDDNNPSNVQT
ncbi:MAG: transposase [Anaerolineales bacterium]|jgi:REP element-mobilizing transposase RayT|nr:transposase [Chloroflexota bacterium]MBK6645544.1 transposase [Anaerolineales bacterium]